MKPSRSLRVVAILALAFAFPTAALAQSLKSAIVGSWLLASVVDEYDGGKQVNNWGSAKGSFFFDANGRFGQIVIGDAQAAMKTTDPRKPDAPVVAYFGTYTVDEAAKTISFKIEAASYSARVGAPFTSSVEMKGDSLVLVGAARTDQHGKFRPRLVLKRASAL